MGMESMDDVNAKAYKAVREAAGGEDFMEKYEKVKPFLDQPKASTPEDTKKIQQRAIEDNTKFNSIKDDLVEEMKTVKTEQPNTIATELTMFTAEKREERTKNRIQMMFSGKNPEAATQPWSDKANEVLKQSGVERKVVPMEAAEKDTIEVVPQKELTYAQKMARNAQLLREETALDTPQKRAANVIRLNENIEYKRSKEQEKKNRAQQLADWWNA
jgi:hypothetical protein